MDKTETAQPDSSSQTAATTDTDGATSPAQASGGAERSTNAGEVLQRYLKAQATQISRIVASLNQYRQDVQKLEVSLIARIGDVDDDRRHAATRLQRTLQTQRDDLDERLKRHGSLMAMLLLLFSLLVAGTLVFFLFKLNATQEAFETQMTDLKKTLEQIDVSSRQEPDPQTRAQLDRLSAALAEISKSIERLDEEAPPGLDLDLRLQPEPKSEPEPAPEPKPQPESAPEPATEPESTPESAPAPDPSSDPETPPSTESESESAPASEPESERPAEAAPTPPEPVTPPSEPETESAPAPESVTELEQTADTLTLDETGSALEAPDISADDAEPSPVPTAAPETESGESAPDRPVTAPEPTPAPEAAIAPDAQTDQTDTAVDGLRSSSLATHPVQVGDRPFTVQLIGFHSLEALEGFAADHVLPVVYYYRQETYQGRPWFVLIHSLHETQEAAEAVVARLPPALANLNIWIRRLKSDTELIEVRRLGS
ncbi:SPOR domain-containing protein [Allochromatium vinosum]|uniref:Sporulation domain protein n=1 Tax=Allochromatium vinosum (strain ATCC 17899 / DSM 180 / NBRC 103801 / NCIMB 10441 / D) TaxID=572477 RepID=D3RNW6_ALLVD|nr:sporulation domain-containing protein [Allochromatium vinosum]ADC61476.1 Sporulation domain protein [Allochromatium vinosum DSM 180]